MWERGSITVFFSLILSLILAVISALLFSAKIAAGRALIAMTMDQAMYSAMAKYDADLLEEYHLFFMDAGFASHTLELGKVLDEVESDISFLLTPSKDKSVWGGIDFLKLSLESSAITGYTLATDLDGSVFREQAVQYMKDTMALQGISHLTENLSKQSKLFQENQEDFLSLENRAENFSLEDLEAAEAAKKSESQDLDEISGENSTVSETVQFPELTKEEKIQIEDAKEILKSVEKLKCTSILNLVVKNPDCLSGWETDKKTLVSNRVCNQGMGVLSTVEETNALTEKYIFQEYILKNINNYHSAYHSTGPAYGVEYIIHGKDSDIENLEGVVEKLLLMRETANALYLYSDTEKRAMVQSLAVLISSAILLPELEPVIEAAFILAWAYVESLVDVRGLLAGNAVPYVKNTSSWQVDFQNLLTAMGNLDKFCKSSGNSYYEDYLSLLLYTKSEETKTMRSMDVIEMTLRGISGKEDFSMDCAVDTLEISCVVLAEERKSFEIIGRQCYRDL